LSYGRRFRGPRRTNFFDSDSNYFAGYTIARAQQLVGDVGSVFDFGCGIGRSMPHLREIFPDADIIGCDPSAESLAIAREQNPTCRFVSWTNSVKPVDLVIASASFTASRPSSGRWRSAIATAASPVRNVTAGSCAQGPNSIFLLLRRANHMRRPAIVYGDSCN
jgi:hypothetical protein